MRLLLLSQQLARPLSGVGTYARGLVEALVARGHEVTLAVPAAQTGELRGVRVVPMAFSPGNLTPMAFPRMARAFAAVLAAEAAHHDVVHFLDAREAVFGLVAGRQADVGSLHDAYALDWCAPSYRRDLYGDRLLRSVYFAWLRWVERAAYHATRRFAANSAHVADAVARGYGLPRQRIEVIPLGLSPSEPVVPIPIAGEPAVLFVGGNYQRKGLGVLLAAVRRLRARLPGIRLHVVGDDPGSERFRVLARRLGIATAVDFHGWRPAAEVRAMIAGASVVAVPSLVEAFGLVYLEALEAGIPVVGTAAGGTAEFFRDGVEALLVPPGDIPVLAAALERIAIDGALRHRLAAAGRAVARRSSIGEMAARTEALYGRVRS